MGSYQVNTDDFKLNIFYNDPTSLNYISPIDNESWPENLEKIRLLNLFDLDKLDVNQNIQQGGDGFFDAIDGITIIQDRGLLIFPTIEPFGEFLFEKLRNSNSEDYSDISTYNKNQKNMYIMNYIQREKHQLKNLLKKISLI